MAKRYGLDSIIGKKSTLRFPRSVTHTKTDTISTIVTANNVISEPPFSTAITMKKGDSLDICDQLNELSYEYEGNFPIKADIVLSNAGAKIEFKTPTVFSLINIIYDLDELIIEKMRSNINDLSLVLANISLAKIDTQENIFLSEIKNNLKTLYGNISSYNCRRRRDKSVQSLYTKRKKYKKTSIISSSKIHGHKRDLHFFVKDSRNKKKERLPLLFDAIDIFYDMYEDWDEFFDEFYQDHYLEESDNMLYNLILLEKYFIETKQMSDKKRYPQILCYQNRLNTNMDDTQEIELKEYNQFLSFNLINLEYGS